MELSRARPLLHHELDSPSEFTPEELVRAVRVVKGLPDAAVPPVCVLEFDGDLTDWLVSHGRATLFEPWACFHTMMYSLEVDGLIYGIVPRTIGGPYAVLIAEQMRVSGVRTVLGLTSAGRVSTSMPIPGLVVATKAIRDEGTSRHYLPPTEIVDAPAQVARLLESELKALPLPVLSGAVWTTDAPYRETEKQMSDYAKAGVGLWRCKLPPCLPSLKPGSFLSA